MINGMTSFDDLRELHRRALRDATAVIDTVGPGDLDRPTPCAGWDLAALLAHMIGQNHGFAAALRDGDAAPDAYRPRAPLPGGPAGTWQRSAGEVGRAVAATPEEREVRLAEVRGGTLFPAATVVRMHLLDTVVHTWDVARSLGRDHRPDGQLVRAVLDVARQVPDGAARRRPGAAFAPAVERAATGPASGGGAADDGTGNDWIAALALLGREGAAVRADRGR